MKSQITYSIAVPAPPNPNPLIVDPSEEKPDIIASSYRAARKAAVKLYGTTVMVIEPYTP